MPRGRISYIYALICHALICRTGLGGVPSRKGTTVEGGEGIRDDEGPVSVRFATAADVEAMGEVEGECFPAAEAASPEQIAARFEAFPEWFLVAEQAGRVIGICDGCTWREPALPDELYDDPSLHDPDGAWQTVFGLAVRPDSRRRGVAGRLLERMVGLARERGKAGVVLTCKDHLVGYYGKFGFEDRGDAGSTHGGVPWHLMVLRF